MPEFFNIKIISFAQKYASVVLGFQKFDTRFSLSKPNFVQSGVLLWTANTGLLSKITFKYTRAEHNCSRLWYSSFEDWRYRRKFDLCLCPQISELQTNIQVSFRAMPDLREYLWKLTNTSDQRFPLLMFTAARRYIFVQLSFSNPEPCTQKQASSTHKYRLTFIPQCRLGKTNKESHKRDA